MVPLSCLEERQYRICDVTEQIEDYQARSLLGRSNAALREPDADTPRLCFDLSPPNDLSSSDTTCLRSLAVQFALKERDNGRFIAEQPEILQDTRPAGRQTASRNRGGQFFADVRGN